jgi:hypothetical protein
MFAVSVMATADGTFLAGLANQRTDTNRYILNMIITNARIGLCQNFFIL